MVKASMKQEQEKQDKKEMEDGKVSEKVGTICHDKKCPFHGNLATRGRSFKGYVTKIFPKRIVIEFERFVYVPKYERYEKRKTRLHAHLPDCLASQVKIGDYVSVKECRPLSKIKHHVLISKIKSAE